MSRRLTLLILIGFGVILGLLAIAGTMAGQATYEGSDKCANCHDDMVELWENTMHGTDFTDWDYHGTPHTNKYTLSGGNDTTGMTGSCAPCHVVGYGLTDIGGFDPSLPWNDSYNAGTDGTKTHLLRIGCENCHGPGSDHTSSKDAADINKGEMAFATSCAGPNPEDGAECHAGYRQYGNETIPGFGESAHWVNEAPDSAKTRVSCAQCRATQGFIARIEGDPWEELPEDEDTIWKVTCMACHDPHPEEGQENEFQLRLPADEICEACHYSTSSFGAEEVHHPNKELRDGTPGYGAPQMTWMEDVSCPECHMYSERRVSQGHLFMPNPKACMECHSMYETPEEVTAFIEEEQEEVSEALEPAIAALGVENEDGTRTGIKGIKDWAEANDLWTDALETAYSEAHWDLTMIEADGSMGFHNPEWCLALIAASVDRINMIEDEMDVGGVSGTLEWKGGNAIEGAMIKDSMGTTVATTDADGAFFFYAPADAMTYTIYNDKSELIGATTIGATALTNVTLAAVTLEKQTTEDDDGDGGGLDSLSYVFIGIIILLVIILVVVAMMGKKAA